MPGHYSKYIKLIYSFGDLVFLNLSAVAGYYLRFKSNDNFYDSQYLSLLLYANLAWLTAASLLNSYSIQRTSRLTNVASTILKQIILFILLVEATLNITKSYFFSRTFLTYSYIILTVTIFIWRLGLVNFFKIYRRKGYNFRNVIIVGWGKAGKELQSFFKSHPEHGYRLLGFFDNQIVGNKTGGNKNIIGSLEDIERYVKENEVDEIYCSPYDLDREQVSRLIDFADNNLIRLKFLPDTSGFNNKKFQVDFYDLLPVIVIRSIPLDDALNKIIKRSFDILFSSCIILFLLSWLLPLLAVIIKMDSKGPIFFKQQRSGINNDSFWCWKLRSMYVNEESNVKQASKNDSRITKVGAFLRKSSLDELPQFFNVFLGNMSVVGPRPHMVKHTEQYSQIIDKYMVRHFIKPGITGLSQVMGYRGDTSDNRKMKGRVKIDIFYLENWSFLLDVKIIFLTVWNVFKGEDNAF
jgi:putative colanic acid biosysnthesis UDP-glucose lipid carrier transferase